MIKKKNYDRTIILNKCCFLSLVDCKHNTIITSLFISS